VEAGVQRFSPGRIGDPEEYSDPPHRVPAWAAGEVLQH